MQKVTARQIKDQFADIFKTATGSLDQSVSAVSSIENAQMGTLIFIAHEKFLEKALQSQASLVLAPQNFHEKVTPSTHQSWFFCRNPELAMALVKKQFFRDTPYRADQTENIHAKAHVDSSAKIHKSALVAAGAFIGSNVTIGANSYIGANSVIEANVTIGENTTIHPTAYIGHSCVIGNRCEVMPQACVGSEGYGYAHDEKGNHFRIPHTGRVILHDDVHVGAGSCIDRGTIEDSIIGQGTKIDNLCHLAHNSVIGKNCLITAQFGMAGSSKIGDNFVCGGKTAVTGHIEIANNVHVAGMSGVTKSIEEPGQYGGFPLQKLQDYLKTKAALAALPELRKQISALIKKQ